ncbi:hypothetical protein CAEBREN_04262 [Caenorhabditis brenneri]|uniref:Uncharacterized protein n=1 Tax=Caenorhabditis brenneri TaxID=135651 RepID=G0NX24_CAEBE|nr:hypothetical protein CAEBREN_04262 [Caenorhabditis brenneri]
MRNDLSYEKKPSFIETCQNNILRLCNDLFRRFSSKCSSCPGDFHKEIYEKASELFRFLVEKSGVNFMGHFNTRNITNYEETDPALNFVLF